MTDIQEFEGYSPTWCPGCGDWGIGASLKRAFVGLGYKPSDVMVVFGIGCSGNMNDFLNAYALHSLHGRSLPNAIGIKFAQHKQPVIAIVGDGDCYGEGGNHFTHACRGNHDITVVVHDNSVYGLTTGQVAPTANKEIWWVVTGLSDLLLALLIWKVYTYNKNKKVLRKMVKPLIKTSEDLGSQFPGIKSTDF
jgi:2-oxoglutarate ferredoxin oxidoreductase subunit beta